MKLRMEHHNVLFLLGGEALVEFAAVAVVEDIIALNAVFFGEIVLELIVCVVKHTVAVKIEPYGIAAFKSQRKQTVVDYTQINMRIVRRIIEQRGNSQRQVFQFIYVFDNLENTFVLLYANITNKICVQPLLACEMRKRTKEAAVLIFYSVYNGLKGKFICFLDININFESPKDCDFDAVSEMFVF